MIRRTINNNLLTCSMSHVQFQNFVQNFHLEFIGNKTLGRRNQFLDWLNVAKICWRKSIFVVNILTNIQHPQITVFNLHQKHYCLTNYSSLHNRFSPEWSFWQVSWELDTIKIVQTSIKVFDRKKSWGTTISQVCLRICFFEINLIPSTWREHP